MSQFCENATAGKTYYISTRTGNDNNNGLCAEQPLFSLRAVARKQIQAGDRILLERGSVFEDDYLHLHNVHGTAQSPIQIASYGEGALPVIHANGQGVWFQNYGVALDDPNHRYFGYVSSAVLLYDCDYIEFSDIAVTNHTLQLDTVYNDLDMMNRTGVAVVAQNAGTLHHIHLHNLDVRHVHGNVYDKHMNNGGIYFTVFLPKQESETGIPRFDDVLVDGCYLEDVNRWGIAVAYTAYFSHFTTKEIPDEVVARYGATNVVIRNNFVKDAGGDAITTMYCDRPLVEFNISDGAGKQINKRDYSQSTLGRVAAAVWPWKCKNALFQYNEVFHTRYHCGDNQDGQAFDADWGDGTIYQYNYSHDNDGGCLMICGEEAVNTVFRYNISQNDSRAILMPASSPTAHIYNNTFYIKEGVPFISTNSDAVGHSIIQNNLVCYSGPDKRIENWYCDVTEYGSNLFWGYQNTPETGSNNVAADPKLQAAGSGKTAEGVKIALDSLQGYQLDADSPAIGAGMVIPDEITRDFFASPITNPPSIGAHQPPIQK